MTTLPVLLVGLFLFLSASGCMTKLNVTKVQNSGASIGKANGYYYSLPIPYLVVKPKGDGTMDVVVEYLPDPDHLYAVSGWSFIAAHELTVEVDTNGLLQKIVWNADDSAAAGALAQSAGTVGAAKIDAVREARKAEDTKSEAQAKAAAEKLTVAKQASDSAQTDYEAAVAERNYIKGLYDHASAIKPNPYQEKLEVAEIAVAKARVKRDATRQAVEELSFAQSFHAPNYLSDSEEKEIENAVSSLHQAQNDLAQTDPTKEGFAAAEYTVNEAKKSLDKLQEKALEKATKEQEKPAWGWVWYRIDDIPAPTAEKPTYELVPVIKQRMYPSGGPPSKASAKPELSLEITEPARGVIVLEKGELLKLTMNPIATFPQHLPFPT